MMGRERKKRQSENELLCDVDLRERRQSENQEASIGAKTKKKYFKNLRQPVHGLQGLVAYIEWVEKTCVEEEENKKTSV